ncbi:Serine/threonine-protein kinase Nek8 [Tetrabaena socialis]|uniref:non-specific serine/threonine protein kinase n=1 Tax=Tetrabaena socialis TaxID=47790 RepID=A0A2J8AFR2_9CHLO|nr:Serine/threonine-protein kinase Nek8 [Tetrabaena socialis]|eukprot:PNH11363.1 Serine/threonine-protein kinase Nek8 [Tetrabaena socialis]
MPNDTANSRLRDYDLGEIIGRGSFGKVFKAVRKSDGRVFALKQVSLENMKRADRQVAIDEARVLAQLNHPHVVRHYDSFIDGDDRLNILMEYAAKGNVQTLVKSFQGRPMPEDAVWRIVIQSLLGLNHIHAKRIIHRDIKSSNLFIDGGDNIKIGDMGIARALSQSSQFAHTLGVGTPYYFSPELCEDKPYNTKTDMWALGVVLYECCMGRYPFDAQNQGALIRKILRGQFPPVQGPYSSALTQLVTSCLTFKPEARPDTSNLLRNPTLAAKARTLNIDLNPRSAQGADDNQAVYEPRPAPQAPQQAAGPSGHPFAAAGGGAGPAGGYGSPQQYPHQQGQVPYPPHHRPGNNGGGAAPGRSPQQAGPPAHDHPFALAGPPGGAYGSPNQGYNGAGAGYGQPPYGSPQQQGYNGQPPPRGSPYAQQQGPYNDADGLAVAVNKMNLRESEVARNGAERLQQAQANIHAGRRDQAKGVIYGGAQESAPRPQRAIPEALPAAGRRPQSGHAGAPYATHYAAGAEFQGQAQSAMTEAWGAVYQAPQYGRRRNPELQITGPSLRSGTVRGGGGGGGGYVPAADDATTYVSSTSYYTSHK